MPDEFSAGEIFRDALYSWETLGPVLKLLIPFAIAGLILTALKTLLNALARFIKRKKRCS